jgi:steroid delta-isomerase-like uncharacterized protein
MSRADTEALIRDYYSAFNAGDMEGFLALLADDVVHDINQGGSEKGKKAFTAFLERMNRSYEEQIVELAVMTNETGTRAASEFIVLGKYLKTDEGLPPAKGQSYRLPAGAFFEVKHGKVARISNFYNLQDWLKQVAG